MFIFESGVVQGRFFYGVVIRIATYCCATAFKNLSASLKIKGKRQNALCESLFLRSFHRNDLKKRDSQSAFRVFVMKCRDILSAIYHWWYKAVSFESYCVQALNDQSISITFFSSSWALKYFKMRRINKLWELIGLQLAKNYEAFHHRPTSITYIVKNASSSQFYRFNL